MDGVQEYTGPEWGNIIYIFQPSCLALISTAIATVACSALRSLGGYPSPKLTSKKALIPNSHFFLILEDQIDSSNTHTYTDHEMDIRTSDTPFEDSTVTLTHHQSIAIPIMSSFSLLALFYFFNTIQLLLLFFLCIFSTIAIVFALKPLVRRISIQHVWLQRKIIVFNRPFTPLGDSILSLLSFILVITWMVTGSILLNNVLAMSLAVAFISFVRLPNIKVGVMLLSALVFYDIFWVFFSSKLFGSNVMVESATKQAENPVFQAAKALHLSSENIAEQIDLPIKLMFPQNLLDFLILNNKNLINAQSVLMLGLGDLALPGIFISFLVGIDVQKELLRSSSINGNTATSSHSSSYNNNHASSIDTRRTSISLIISSWKFWKQSYSLVSYLGYSTGLFLALAFSTIFQAAQPALIYLVPGCVIPVFAKAWRKREMKALLTWSNDIYDIHGGIFGDGIDGGIMKEVDV